MNTPSDSMLCVQQRGVENVFDPGEISRQTFGVRVAKKHFEHFLILADAEWKWIVSESRCLGLSLIALEVEISGTGEIRPLIGGLFALAKYFVELTGEPGIVIEQAPLGDDDVIGRH
jgi:hypothetical protein